MKLNITKENKCPATGQQQKYKVHQNRTSQQVPLGGGKNSDSAPCRGFKHGGEREQPEGELCADRQTDCFQAALPGHICSEEESCSS